MGIVARQSIKNTIYSYLGFGLAAFYSIFIVPRVFNDHPEYWGVIQLIMSYVTILSTISLLGIPNILINFHNNFKDSKPSFLFFAFMTGLFGLVVVSSLFYFLKDFFIKSGIEKNNLFAEYFYLIFVILFLLNIFLLFYHYSVSNLKTSFPTFLVDSFMKFVTLGLLLVYSVGWIGFNQFILFFALSHSMLTAAIVIYLVKLNLFKIKVSFDVFNGPLFKKIMGYGSISILSNGANTLINKLDIIMVGRMIDLESVAYYSMAYFFITILMVPVRSILSIAVPVLTRIGLPNREEFKRTYYKTLTNVTIASGFIYIFILFNINELMILLGEKFGQIKWIVLILSTSKLFQIMNTLNSRIIVFSKFYRYDFLFQMSLLFLTVISNIILIPIYGMTGAAIATAISIILNGCIRVTFVYLKFKLFLFSKEVIKALMFLLILGAGSFLLPKLGNVYVSILIKSVIVGVSFVIFLFVSKISQEINDILVSKVFEPIGLKINKLKRLE